MMKQTLIYIFLSIIVVLASRYVHMLLVYIDLLYNYLSLQLAPFLNHSAIGRSAHRILTLVILPIAITGIPALLYRLFKGKIMPHFIAITWLVWFVIVLSEILVL